MRFLGLDFGAKTLGVAVSDASETIAQRVETIRRERASHLRKTLARLETLVQTYDAEAFVLGMPFNMDGTKGERAEATLEFKAHLERRMGLPVYLQDERLSSFAAEEIMAQTGVKRTEFRTNVDMIAAEIILQDFLNARKEHGTDYTGN